MQTVFPLPTVQHASVAKDTWEIHSKEVNACLTCVQFRIHVKNPKYVFVEGAKNVVTMLLVALGQHATEIQTNACVFPSMLEIRTFSAFHVSFRKTLLFEFPSN